MDFNPYAPPKQESDAIDVFRWEMPQKVRQTYAQDEANLGACFLIYVACGILIAIPATGAVSGGIFILASPRMLEDAGFWTTMGILGIGLVLAGASFLYLWTGWGIAYGLRSATGTGFALILPLLFFAPAGTIAGWAILRTLTSEGSRIVTTREYRQLKWTTLFPRVRVPWLLIFLQASVIIQVVVVLMILI